MSSQKGDKKEEEEELETRKEEEERFSLKLSATWSIGVCFHSGQ